MGLLVQNGHPAAGQVEMTSRKENRRPAVAVADRKSWEREPTLDRDALDALAWIGSAIPDDKVAYGPDVPRLTPEQIARFEPGFLPLGAKTSLSASQAAREGQIAHTPPLPEQSTGGLPAWGRAPNRRHGSYPQA